MKAALCGGLCLHFPDFSLLFVMQTDTSDKELRAILSQVVEGEECPMLDISCKFLVRETKYSTIKTECLTVGVCEGRGMIKHHSVNGESSQGGKWQRGHTCNRFN